MTIKINHLLIIVFLITSCKNKLQDKVLDLIPENSKTIVVQLIDSLGTVTLSMPTQYDTSFLWIHFSDCGKPCNKQKYRFQSKSLPIIKESGMFWYNPKDSVDRISISHSGYFPFYNLSNDSNIINRNINIRHMHLKENLASDPNNPPIIFDTIQKINDRYFSIFEMQKLDSVKVKSILAVTTIKGNEISFLYELFTKKDDMPSKYFIKNSIKLIKTIRLSKGM